MQPQIRRFWDAIRPPFLLQQTTGNSQARYSWHHASFGELGSIADTQVGRRGGHDLSLGDLLPGAEGEGGVTACVGGDVLLAQERLALPIACRGGIWRVIRFGATEELDVVGLVSLAV